MIESGRSVTFDGAPKIDKHSTGGVGDRSRRPAPGPISIPVARRRTLHVGKHRGFRVKSRERVRRSRLETWPGDDGPDRRLRAADKLLGALRDVTATVECIRSSRRHPRKRSPKASGLVLDIKGRLGRLHENPTRRRGSPRASCRSARSSVSRCAVLTDMNRATGQAVGHSPDPRMPELEGKGRPALTSPSSSPLTCSGRQTRSPPRAPWPERLANGAPVKFANCRPGRPRRRRQTPRPCP